MNAASLVAQLTGGVMGFKRPISIPRISRNFNIKRLLHTNRGYLLNLPHDQLWLMILNPRIQTNGVDLGRVFTQMIKRIGFASGVDAA
jgi:hypothetical protein